MEKNKTPLALAIEELQLIQPKSNHPDYWYGLQTAIDILENLKPKEKETLKKSYEAGEENVNICYTYMPFDEYFDNNLTQE